MDRSAFQKDQTYFFRSQLPNITLDSDYGDCPGNNLWNLTDPAIESPTRDLEPFWIFPKIGNTLQQIQMSSRSAQNLAPYEKTYYQKHIHTELQKLRDQEHPTRYAERVTIPMDEITIHLCVIGYSLRGDYRTILTMQEVLDDTQSDHEEYTELTRHLAVIVTPTGSKIPEDELIVHNPKTRKIILQS